MVRFQQPIFKIPELEHMQVKVNIHESKVKKIQKDQKAEIRVEAYPNKVLSGIVKSVATVADSRMPWIRGNVKEYETIVEVIDLPSEASLKPGMTAEVSIKVNHLADVTLVPVQTVAERKGQHFVYVSRPSGVERRNVTVGESNEKFVEIKEGLEPGEQVCLDARARGAAEVKDEEKAAEEPRVRPPEAKP
jgi:RND family efflux transporter MFP subunit